VLKPPEVRGYSTGIPLQVGTSGVSSAGLTFPGGFPDGSSPRLRASSLRRGRSGDRAGTTPGDASPAPTLAPAGGAPVCEASRAGVAFLRAGVGWDFSCVPVPLPYGVISWSSAGPAAKPLGSFCAGDQL